MEIEENNILKAPKDSSESEEIKDLSFESHKRATDEKDSEKETLFKILKSIMLTDFFSYSLIEDISENTKLFLYKLLKKKFHLNSNLEIKGIRKQRRNEEKFKYVVKRGFKYLFKKFKALNHFFILGTKKLDEIQFYKYYFEEISIKLNLPIDLFYLPGSKLQKYSIKCLKFDKTVSTCYMEKIFLSKKFKEDFIKYVLNEFSLESYKIRDEKIMKILDKFKNDKYKNLRLPWTNNEISFAQQTLINYITNYIK